MAHAFNPKHLGNRSRQISESKASRVNSRTIRATKHIINFAESKQNKTKTYLAEYGGTHL